MAGGPALPVSDAATAGGRFASSAAAVGGGGAAPGGAVRDAADLLGLGFQLININSAKCLTVSGGATVDGAALVQRTCDRAPAYRWRFIPVSFTGLFLIQNVLSGKCLTGADVAVQHACDASPARRWQLRKPPGVPHTVANEDALLVNAHSRRCLTIAGGGTGEDGAAVQDTCGAERSRRWTVRVVAGPVFGRGAAGIRG